MPNYPLLEAAIVALSASVRGEDHQHGLEAGADAYLAKPIASGLLIATLELAGPGRSLLPRAARHAG